MLGYTNNSIYPLRLSGGIDQLATFHIVVHIRDTFNCITELILSPVTVMTDSALIVEWIEDLQPSAIDSLIQLTLASADENTIGQLVTSIANAMNQFDTQLMQAALASNYYHQQSIFVAFSCLENISATSIAVTPLRREDQSLVSCLK